MTQLPTSPMYYSSIFWSRLFFLLCTGQDATITEIVDAADAPLSIVIVGVGQGDFTAMERLDGDRQRLTSPFTGKVCSKSSISTQPLYF